MTANLHLEDLDESDLRIDFAFDTNEQRLACVSTVGLWPMGLPELFIRPPTGVRLGNAEADARLTVFLATGLIHLASALLAADDFDIPLYQGELDGEQIRFRLGDQEPPSGELTAVLGPEVDTVIRVDCSIWCPHLRPDWAGD